MGGRTGDFFSKRAKGQQAKRRADFSQAQKQYDSRKRFGQTSTRVGGLTSEQIGQAPVMGSGFSFDPWGEDKNRNFGFGGTNSTLG